MNSLSILTQKVKIAQFMVLALMSSVVFCGIYLFITRENASLPGLESKDALILRVVLYGASLGTLAALKYVVPLTLKATKEERNSEEAMLTKLQTFSIVCASFSESIGIYGFILTLLIHNLFDYVVLSVIAFMAFSVNFPNEYKWQNWITYQKQRVD